MQKGTTRTCLSAWALLLLLATCLANNSASAAPRVALVIGNGDYQVAPLKNPVNDAGDISAMLEHLGFEVITETDATKRTMINALNRFSQLLARAEIGLFYYAGHGMQIDGRNYLIPTGISVGSESDVEFEAVDIGRIMGKMDHAGNKLNVVILDACRNNPFARTFRSPTKGLARMDAPVGTIVAYATSPGSVAADGAGRNGLFTKHLLAAMKKPDLDIQDMFNEAGIGVMKETGNSQVPWMSSTPIPRYYLASYTPSSDQNSVSDGSASTVDPPPSNNFLAREIPEEIRTRGRLRVGLEPGYMPFEMTGKNGNIIGFDIDIAKKMAEELGVELEIVPVPWNGIIPSLNSGTFDVLLSGMTILETRQEHVDFVPYFTCGQTLLIRKDIAGSVSSYRDLNTKKYKVASKLGTVPERIARKLMPKARYTSYETEQDGVSALLAGKVDAFVYDMPYNAIVSMKHGQSKLVHLDTLLVEEPFGIATRKSSQEISRWIFDFMDKIRRDGSYNEIYSKWFKEGAWLKEL